MTAVEIEYCVPCGVREQAEDIQNDILDALVEDIDRIALVPGHGGVIVRVDGEQVFHSGEDEYDKENVNERIVDDVADAIED